MLRTNIFNQIEYILWVSQKLYNIFNSCFSLQKIGKVIWINVHPILVN